MPDSQPRQPQTGSAKPPVPTMTNDTVIPQLEDVPLRTSRIPDELAEDIVAKPLGAPDFANDVKPFLANPNLWPRWIFTDIRRFNQAQAQGWRVCKAADLKPGYLRLTPFSKEGGTKFINGDLILMLIDRKVYLGALRYKHMVAAAYSDAAVQKTVAAGRAVSELGATVAAVNRQRAAQGAEPVMTVFTPGAADLTHTVLGQPGVAAKEGARLGNASLDMGTMADLANQSKGE